MNKIRTVICFIVGTLALVACSAAAPLQSAAPAPKLEKNIVYGSPGGENLMFDFTRPTTGNGPFPLIIWLHGGGWRQGNRSDYHEGMLGFAKLGYAGATLQYRFAPKHKFPAQIEDLRMALAFLRANAVKYKLDPNRIGVVGASAGGHLGLLLGLAPESSGQPSPGIRAVVSYGGPAHFPSWRIGAEAEKFLRDGVGANGLDGLLADFLGTADRNAPIMTIVSPAVHASKGDPAVLSLQGGADPLSPPQQALVLHTALRNAGVVEKVVVYPGGGHGLEGDQAGQSIVEMLNFLNTHVRDGRWRRIAPG